VVHALRHSEYFSFLFGCTYMVCSVCPMRQSRICVYVLVGYWRLGVVLAFIFLLQQMVNVSYLPIKYSLFCRGFCMVTITLEPFFCLSSPLCSGPQASWTYKFTMLLLPSSNKRELCFSRSETLLSLTSSI